MSKLDAHKVSCIRQQWPRASDVAHELVFDPGCKTGHGEGLCDRGGFELVDTRFRNEVKAGKETKDTAQ